ncbi:MAG: flippase-like domain-containing protein [Sediminibacterium sp.]|nr:flippase-like domain-containing protein [Sediminibacterium sp.]
MKIKWLSVIQYIIFLGIGIFLVWWSLHQIPDEKWEEFKDSMKSANYWLMIPVFLILSSSHIIRAMRWKILMKPMGYSPGILNVFFAVMIGYLANLAIPRLGEVLRCTILSRYEKIPADKLIGTILVERAFDVLCLGIVFVVAFISQYNIIGGYALELFHNAFESRSGQFSVQKITIVLIVLSLTLATIFYLFKKLNHLSIVTAVKKIIRGVWEGLISIRNLQQKGRFLLYSAAIWTLYIGGTWVGLWATSGTESLGLPAAISALAFASIGMIITPGGIGAYAFFLAKVLEKNGVSFEIGFANGTLQWFAQFIIILIVGFICLGLLPWYNKKYAK